MKKNLYQVEKNLIIRLGKQLKVTMQYFQFTNNKEKYELSYVKINWKEFVMQPQDQMK